MTSDSLVILSFLIPIITALVVVLLGRLPNIREAISILGAALLFVVNVLLYSHTTIDSAMVLATPFNGLSIAFSVNAFGNLFAMVASGLWIVTTIYAVGYMRSHHEKNQTRFFALFAIALSLVMAVAYSDNLLTLFLCYELLTVSTYPLVTHAGTEKARQGGRTYLLLLMGSSILFFLPAIVITYSLTGTLDFTTGGILQGHIDSKWLTWLGLMFLLGIGKAGLMPVHKWLPSAMVAPTPVSALLHAVAVVKAGVFAIFKVFTMIIGPQFLSESSTNDILLWLPMFTIIAASFIAMTKDNIKERLAYSTISQLSYIVLGVLIANHMGLLGGGLHLVMHAFAKITLFFAAGTILVTTHKTKVSELDGLGTSMPLTFSFFTIGTLSIIGLPIFGGMWSKWYLLTGSADFTGSSVTQIALFGTLMLSSLLNIAYLLSIPAVAFFKTSNSSKQYSEAPLFCLLGMAVPAAICIYLFVDPQIAYDVAAGSTGLVP